MPDVDALAAEAEAQYQHDLTKWRRRYTRIWNERKNRESLDAMGMSIEDAVSYDLHKHFHWLPLP